jgi:hypothetical protein
MPQTGHHPQRGWIDGSQDFFAFEGLLFLHNLLQLQRGGGSPEPPSPFQLHPPVASPAFSSF